MEQSIFTTSEFKKLKPAKGGKRQKKEEKVQLQVCDYLRTKYPDLIWFCDLASGLFLPPWIAAMNKKMRSSRALPDLFIAHPIGKVVWDQETFEKMGIKSWKREHLFSGLFIEAKKDGIRRKDGTIPPAWRKEKVGKIWVKYDHHAEQQAIIDRLNAAGYKATFGVGYDECIKIIDDYLQ